MLNKIKTYYSFRPLRTVLIAALLIRLIAAIFSRGYGMHDDHFLVIEAAQSWADGYDYNDWLPRGDEEAVPSGHSLFYSGIHYAIFSTMHAVGIDNPQVKMFFIRLLHVFYSLLIVWFTFKITYRLSRDQKLAGHTALVVALMWFLPGLSVRNLFEVNP